MVHTLLNTDANLLTSRIRVFLDKLIVAHLITRSHLCFQTPSDVLMVMCGLLADGGSMFLRNVCTGPKYYMAQQPITLPYVPLCPLLMLFECQMLKTVIKGKATFTNCKTFNCTLILHTCRDTREKITS
jgi:hypothetical protein